MSRMLQDVVKYVMSDVTGGDDDDAHLDEDDDEEDAEDDIDNDSDVSMDTRNEKTTETRTKRGSVEADGNEVDEAFSDREEVEEMVQFVCSAFVERCQL